MKNVLLAAAISAFAMPAMALTDAQEYAELLNGAKITLVEATEIAAAKLGGGDVVKAELDNHRLKVVYEVGVLTQGKLYEVNVNAATGEVINVKEDRD